MVSTYSVNSPSLLSSKLKTTCRLGWHTSGQELWCTILKKTLPEKGFNLWSARVGRHQVRMMPWKVGNSPSFFSITHVTCKVKSSLVRTKSSRDSIELKAEFWICILYIQKVDYFPLFFPTRKIKRVLMWLGPPHYCHFLLSSKALPNANRRTDQ